MARKTMGEAQRAAYEAEDALRVLTAMQKELETNITIDVPSRTFILKGDSTVRFVAFDGTVYEVKLAEPFAMRSNPAEARSLSVRTGICAGSEAVQGRPQLAVVPSASNLVYVTSG